MSTSLKNVFKPAASKSNSSKTPKFYNEEKNRCIIEGASNSEGAVRMYFATSDAIPTKILVGMLQVERDKQILRAILMNNKLPRKAAAAFVTNATDDRVEWFEGDVEVLEHFTKE